MQLSPALRAAVVGSSLIALPPVAQASPIEPAKASRAEIGEPALAPFAHVLFCKRYSAECVADEKPGETLVADQRTLAALRRVNMAVNRAIRPKPDAPGPLGDAWRIAPPTGDCDDYAVTKRHRLIALGFPASALRLAVTRTRQGDGHAVLVARTNKGDLVLDNRNDRLSSWSRTGLSLEKLQSGADPQRWFSAIALVAYSE